MPVVADIQRPIQELVKNWRKQAIERKERLEFDIDAIKARIKDAPRNQRLSKQLCDLEAKLTVEKERPIPRLFADDCTPEQLASLLHKHDRIGIVTAEGGVFGQMAGMYNRSQYLPLDVYLKGHAGDELIVDRVNREPIVIPSPSLALGLAVQPDVVMGLFHQRTFRRRGLLARFLFSMPKSLLGSRDSNALPVPKKDSDGYRNCIMNIGAIVDKTPASRPIQLKLSVQGA